MRDDDTTVAVKYCGGCNPRIDRERIAAAMAGAGARLVYPGKDGGEPATFLLIINGCETGCVSPEDYPGYRYTLAVRGQSVDHCHCPEDQLPGSIIEIWLKTRGLSK